MTTTGHDPYAVLQRYGVPFQGDQSVPDWEAIHARPSYTLRELVDAGGKVTRVRIFRDTGYMDLSNVLGTLNGEQVRVDSLPHIFCPRGQFKGQLIQWAREEGVFALGCGLLDEGNWSVL
jgi:hypothetical protein